MSLTLETVAHCSSEAEAEFLVMRLKDKGIKAYIANQFTHALQGAVPFTIADIWVQVSSTDVSQAQEIADEEWPELDESEAAALEAAAEELAACPQCGAENPEYSEEDGRIIGTCPACGHRWSLQ